MSLCWYSLSRLLCCVSLTSLFAAGCGGQSLASIRGEVKGTVTLDGEPLKSGSIQFTPAEGTTGPTAGARIADGAFEMSLEQGAAIGTNKVQISSPRPTGNQIKSAMTNEMIDEVEEAIPEKYNTKSKLQEDVQAGKNEFSFDLESN